MTAQRGGDTPDPLLIAEIEDMFAALHPLDLLDEVLASTVPDRAAEAYAQMVVDPIDTVDGNWNGEQA